MCLPRLVQGMACAALAVASLATLVLSLHSLHSLLMGGIFVMVGADGGRGRGAAHGEE